MGVKGLWQVLEASGQPVTLESLEGKILAVDISIWLNQSLRGVRDKYGTAKAEAHLQTLFTRICKLLYYRIKPIFVFDGRMPALKLETLNRRRNLREKATKKSDEIRSKLLKNLVKQQALHAVLSTQAASEEKDALFNEQQLQNTQGAVKPKRPPRRAAAAAVITSGRNIDVETDLFLIPGGDLPESSSSVLADAMDEDADMENDADYVVDDGDSDAEEDDTSEDDEITEIEAPKPAVARANGVQKKFSSKLVNKPNPFKHRRVTTNMPTPDVAAELLSSSSSRRASGNKPTGSSKRIDIDNVDFDAEEFKSLPSQVRHDILLDLDASRKNHSWAKVKYMPDDSNDFSGFQLGRMMKRQKIHKHLDDSVKEINARLTESIFAAHMPNSKSAVNRITNIQSRKLASEDSTHFLLVNMKAPSSSGLVDESNEIANKADVVPDGGTNASVAENSVAAVRKMINDTIDVSSSFVDDADVRSASVGENLSSIAAAVSLADEYMDLLFEDAAPAPRQEDRKSKPVAASVISSDLSETRSADNRYAEIPVVKNSRSRSGTVTHASADDNRKQAKANDVRFVAPATPPPPRSIAANSITTEISVVSSKLDGLAFITETNSTSSTAAMAAASDDGDKRKVIDLLGHCIELELSTPTDLRAALDRQQHEKQERRKKRYLRVEDVFASVVTTSSTSAAGATHEAVQPTTTAAKDKHNSLHRGLSNTDSSETSTRTTKSTGDEDQEILSDNDDDVFMTNLLSDKVSSVLAGAVGVGKRLGNGSADSVKGAPETAVLTPSVTPDGILPTSDGNDTDHHDDEAKNDADEAGDDDDDAEFIDVIDTDKNDDEEAEHNSASDGSSPLILDEISNHQIDSSVLPLLLTQEKYAEVENVVAEADEVRPEFVDDLIGLEDIDFDERNADVPPSSSAQLASAVSSTQLRRVISSEEREKLDQLDADLSSEQLQLLRAAGREQRMATSVTDQIISDCIELLKLFGLPFVMAPSEAEAQCAYLDATGQTQGSITDDSDAWLFGARRIYKSFFNQRHKVEFYSAEACYKSVGLTRERMIAFAMLTGCDYTDGLQGVGSVAGMEILAEFGTDDDATNKAAAEREISSESLNNSKNSDDAEKLLCSFARWYRDARQRLSDDDAAKRTKNKFRQKLKNLLETTPPSSNFPDHRVIDAFRRPLVDESRAPFSWQRPNLDGLRQFTRMRLGWSTAKSDELLMPVVKRQLDEAVSGKQRRIDEYFVRKPPAVVRVVKDAAVMAGSKRLNKAISRVKSLRAAENDDVEVVESHSASNKTVRRTASENQQKSVSSNSGGGFFESFSSQTSSQEEFSDGKQSFLRNISADDVSGVEDMLAAKKRRGRAAVAEKSEAGNDDEEEKKKIAADQLEHRRANKRALGICDDSDRNVKIRRAGGALPRTQKTTTNGTTEAWSADSLKKNGKFFY